MSRCRQALLRFLKFYCYYYFLPHGVTALTGTWNGAVPLGHTWGLRHPSSETNRPGTSGLGVNLSNSAKPPRVFLGFRKAGSLSVCVFDGPELVPGMV